MIYVAKYILTEEYVCKCCHGTPPDLDLNKPSNTYWALFDRFALIRKKWGAPINISSGYRCPGHNNHIGGHPQSAHVFGLALDLDVESDQVDDLHKIIEEVAPDVRMGKYPGFIHIDVAWKIYPRARHVWVKGYRWSGE